MLDWLNATALRVLGETASWAELLGFATGLWCVWLVVRQRIANWPVGIVNVVLLMVAFWASGLYADAGLQIVYVVLGFYGWWQWYVGGIGRGPGAVAVSEATGAGRAGTVDAVVTGRDGAGRSGRTAGTRLDVRKTTRVEWIALAVGGVIATAVLWRLLTTVLHSTVPLADAVTTALSLLATYGQCRKLLESWWLWIAADVIYIPLYGYKHLYLTTVLYCVFLGLSIVGLRAWRGDLRTVGDPVPA